jgi:hypothetical protein
LIRNHKAAREKEAVEKAERAAAKANKAKSKRKSMDVAADEDADAMDVDDEAAETKPKSKKRKKSLGSEGIEEKVSIPCLSGGNFTRRACGKLKRIPDSAIARQDSQNRHQAETHEPQDTCRSQREEESGEGEIIYQEIGSKG